MARISVILRSLWLVKCHAARTWYAQIFVGLVTKFLSLQITVRLGWGLVIGILVGQLL